MPRRPSTQLAGIVLVIVLYALYAWLIEPRPVKQRAAAFDFYLLALTVESAFCEDNQRPLQQCQRLSRQSFAQMPLVLHGLWPERNQPETYPRDCGGGRLALSPGLRVRVERWMPGTEVDLDVHEWRKHGSCSALSGEQYFAAAVDWTERTHGLLADALAASAGQRVRGAALRAAVEAKQPGFGRSLIFMCKNLRSRDPQKRSRPYLYEVRLCLDNDGANGAPQSLLECAAVGRRDQGCGDSFWIDDV